MVSHVSYIPHPHILPPIDYFDATPSSHHFIYKYICVCISLWSELHESLPRISTQGHMRLKPRFQLSFYLEACGENHCNLILMVDKIQFPISCRFEVLISSLSVSPLFAPKAHLNFICVPFNPLSNH